MYLRYLLFCSFCSFCPLVFFFFMGPPLRGLLPSSGSIWPGKFLDLPLCYDVPWIFATTYFFLVSDFFQHFFFGFPFLFIVFFSTSSFSSCSVISNRGFVLFIRYTTPVFTTFFLTPSFFLFLMPSFTSIFVLFNIPNNPVTSRLFQHSHSPSFILPVQQK